MIVVAILTGAVASILALAAAVRRSMAWPEPIARPYECFPCRARYTSAQHLVWHQAQHRADFAHDKFAVLRGYRLGGGDGGGA